MTRLISLAACMIVLLVVAAPSLATVISYNATLNGFNEFPSNASPAIGFAQVDYDNIAQTLHVQASFSGLLGTTTASHIHSATLVPGTGTAGVATTTPTFAGFPLGVTSGAYNNLLDLTQSSSWNPSYITAQGGTTADAEAALASSLAAGTAYFNIHTTAFTGGEIRGFLTPVPEPATLLILALGGLLIRHRK
jgi:hypothetical protein